MSIGKVVLCRNWSEKYLLKLRYIWYTRSRTVVPEPPFRNELKQDILNKG